MLQKWDGVKMGNYIDILHNVYIHPVYGEYEVISREESRNNVAYFKIKFKNTGYEATAKSSHIRNQCVKDKLYYKQDLIGKTFANTKGQKYIVVKYDNEIKGNYYIRFIKSNNIISRRRNNIVDGLVYDELGTTDTTIYNNELNKKVRRRSYTIYKAMLKRIDSRGSKVCEEWKNSYKNFLDWLYNIELPKHNVSIYEYETYKKLCDYDLDKDFYGGEEKLYCPENCRLIHHDFNMSLRNLSNCDIILSKDGKDIRITNVIDFLEGNGYKIKPPQ